MIQPPFLEILGRTDRSETVAADTETVASSFSQWRVLFGCQVSLPSAEKPMSTFPVPR